ncbi:hypothetical protein [Aquimarina mytili]|uniref:Uncharacterized protein n=1 Tax=Aquimarina mytili TaxID=874423 RepID=A0A936ZZU1_9FLAO|nr:hypothetical protein [Aquimarina mytili]MBL0684196.1 hypothetical protein [Aquimarina mytili]
MLKGKKGLYILLPVVAFVWGAIIFQVVGAFSDEDPVFEKGAEVNIAPLEEKERDTFSIGFIERDPFLGTLYKPKKKVVVKPKSITKKPPLVWPSIIYKGVVSDHGNANAIYLIGINGTDQLMQLKQTISEVTLMRGGSNTVRVKYKGKIKEFKIAN